MPDSAMKRLLSDIRTRFPECGPIFDAIPQELDCDRIEAVAALTTRCLGERHRDTDKARAYLDYMSEKFRASDAETGKLIDTYFVECLFYHAPDSTIKLGWPLVPENLKRLYITFHGHAPKIRGK
jgi:hypothetical protein